MEDILNDALSTHKPALNKKLMIFFIAYIPASLIFFLICSPVFLKIYNNEIGDQWAAGHFIAGFAILLMIIALLVIKRFSVMYWKIYLILIIESIVAFAGMVLIFALLNY